MWNVANVAESEGEPTAAFHGEGRHGVNVPPGRTPPYAVRPDLGPECLWLTGRITPGAV